MERRKMQKKQKRIFAVLLSAILVVALTGCSKLGSIINEIHGSLIGNNYTVYTYDNYGNQTLKTSGKKISITGNKIETVSYDSDGRAVTGYDLSSVITITIDGKKSKAAETPVYLFRRGWNRRWISHWTRSTVTVGTESRIMQLWQGF